METNRRQLIATLGSFSVVTALGLKPNFAVAANLDSPYGFFSLREGVLIRALLSQLIPNDGDGPGALESGVDRFLDRMLASAYGKGRGQYLEGGSQSGSPTQGYQLALDPAQFYRLALADTDRWSRTELGTGFAELGAAQQLDALKQIQSGKAELDVIPGPLWFRTLWFDTQCGYFSDPIYGGNRDMGGWRHIGYPGAAHEFRQYLGRRDAVRVPPVGLSQLIREQGA